MKNREELLKILQDKTDGFYSQSRLRDGVLEALEKVQKEAINFTDSSIKLEEWHKNSFKYWLKENGYKQRDGYFTKNKKYFDESTIIARYNEELENL